MYCPSISGVFGVLKRPKTEVESKLEHFGDVAGLWFIGSCVRGHDDVYDSYNIPHRVTYSVI